MLSIVLDLSLDMTSKNDDLTYKENKSVLDLKCFVSKSLRITSFSRLNTLCTPLVWMRIAKVATLYTPSGYVIGMLQCSVHNSNIELLQCFAQVSLVLNILYTADESCNFRDKRHLTNQQIYISS